MPAHDRPRRTSSNSINNENESEAENSSDDPDYSEPVQANRVAVGTADGIIDDDDQHEEAAVTAPAAKPKRGRPCKAKEPDMPLFAPEMDDEFHPVFSLTYGKGKSHMPPIWHTSMTEFLEEYSSKFVNSRERGAKDELLRV